MGLGGGEETKINKMSLMQIMLILNMQSFDSNISSPSLFLTKMAFG